MGGWVRGEGLGGGVEEVVELVDVRQEIKRINKRDGRAGGEREGDVCTSRCSQRRGQGGVWCGGQRRGHWGQGWGGGTCSPCPRTCSGRRLQCFCIGGVVAWGERRGDGMSAITA